MRNAKRIFISGLLIVLGTGSGCTVFQKSVNPPLTYQYVDHSNTQVDKSIAPDSVTASLITPYAEELESIMHRVLVKSAGRFEVNQPEGTLGNLIADIVRRRASLELGTWVDMSVINNGGLRRPITKGKVTVRDIYELMPFENTLIILTMSGTQVQNLADEIVETGGEPVSGLRLRNEEGQAEDVLVGTRTLSADSTYLVATNNYLVDGGGSMPSLWEAAKVNDTGLSIRQVIIDYLEAKRTIEPQLDGRIR